MIGKFFVFGESHVHIALGGLGKAGSLPNLVSLERAAKYVSWF